ncbi:MAG: alpha/beta hydrolase [Clostridium sp.]|jgi:acetyl esterase/lipase|nr:alpha/beta hydrolase [Clostridium sp.]
MEADKKYPMRLAKFRDGWMDMTPELPEPRIDRIDEKLLDLPYGDDPLQKMDVYYPNQKREKYPLFVVIHGGGWSHMDKRDWHLYPSFFALERGFMVISVNYRLAPKNKLPAATYDCFAAMEYIAAHAGKLKLDTDNVFVWGCSAGGNLGAATVLKFSHDERINIKAMVAVVPALDFSEFYGTFGKAIGSEAMTKELNNTLGTHLPACVFKLLRRFIIKAWQKEIFGRAIDFDKEPLREYDASYYLNDKSPKFYFSFGEKDPLIAQSDIRRFAARLLEHGLTESDIVFDCVKDAPHMGATRHFFEDEVILRYINFCTSLLD